MDVPTVANIMLADPDDPRLQTEEARAILSREFPSPPGGTENWTPEVKGK